jgi:hypothetical protein
MWEDSIVDEVRSVREEHAAKFNYDIEAIINDLQEKRKKFCKTVVSYIDGKYVVVDQLCEPSSEEVVFLKL